MSETMTAQVRNFLKAHPDGSLRELYDEFLFGANPDFRRALERLEKRRELYMDAGAYHYGRKHGNSLETKLTTIWRALRNMAKVRRVVDIKEVARIAGADMSYARRYIKHLEGLGYVRQGPTGLAVLDKAMGQSQTPPFNQREERKKKEVLDGDA